MGWIPVSAVRLSRLSLVALLGFLLAGCDNGILWRDGQYIVWWHDTRSNVEFCRDLGGGRMVCLAGPKVLAIASTPRWLTVAVESENGTEITYSYMDKTLDSKYLDGADIMVGPLKRAEFDAVKDQLSLPEPQPFS